MCNHNATNKNWYTSDIFWDVICLTRGGGLFSSYDRTYLKIVSGGWLMRHVFFGGRRFMRSAIIFFPDSQNIWADFNFEILWEAVNKQASPNYNLILERFKTPEGWVVKEFLTSRTLYSNDGATGVSLTYIPDPTHCWENTPRNIKTPDEE